MEFGGFIVFIFGKTGVDGNPGSYVKNAATAPVTRGQSGAATLPPGKQAACAWLC